MSYLTTDELQSRVGGIDALRQLTDDDQDEAPDAGLISLVPAGAESEANFWFRAGGYTVPLTDSTSIAGVKWAVLDIANYRLKSRGDREPSEADIAAYDKARDFLRQIAIREILLEVVSAAASAYPFFESDDPIFDRASLATM